MNRARLSKEESRAAARLFVALLFAATVVMVVAPPAAAYHQSIAVGYFSGSISTNEFHTRTSSCSSHEWANQMSWDTSSAYGTVAIIAAGGTWIANTRTNTGSAYTQVSPSNPDAYKALCKNSTPWQITVNASCAVAEALYDGQCV